MLRLFTGVLALHAATYVAFAARSPWSHRHDADLAKRILSTRAAAPFFAPNAGGGSQLDNATSVLNGLGEPLNVIISGQSSPGVLTDDGFLGYSRALGFSKECFGLHLGGFQQANLGDGHGWLDQTNIYREDFGEALLGTCLESLKGGNHYRIWRQNGPTANSGALFLAVSKEEDASQSHNIIPDGYNIGRDLLVTKATAGPAYFLTTKYTTTVEWTTGLLPAGSDGVNHGIAQDGRVAVFTVTASEIFGS